MFEEMESVFLLLVGSGRIRRRDEILAWFTWLHSPKEKTLVENMDADDPWFRSVHVKLFVENLEGDV